MNADGWFAIYRSETDTLNPQKDEIVDINFGRDAYQVIDSFDGLQDFNGIYRYYAGALNRYWLESDPSNYTDSDPIPSFAPIVLSSEPIMNDTISVNASITIQFSKTMDTENFQNEIQLTPAILAQSVNWSDANKVATIRFETNFAFDTPYTLELSANVSDINGRQLDGNGDGMEGDPFILTFRTKAVDLDGPVIIYSNIQPDGSTNDFDIAGVLTVVFDEMVKDSTINDNSVFITLGEDTIETKYLVFNRKERSEINVQPVESLLPGRIYSLVSERINYRHTRQSSGGRYSNLFSNGILEL